MSGWTLWRLSWPGSISGWTVFDIVGTAAVAGVASQGLRVLREQAHRADPPYSQVEFASNRYSVPADKCVLAEQAGSLHQPVLSSHHVAQVSG